MANVAVTVFAFFAALTWLSIFGYLIALAALTRLRSTRAKTPAEWPEIAIIVPTLNEEDLILRKLEDLRRTRYPGRAVVAVVDGGSRDRTVDLVQGEIDRGEPIRLLRLSSTRGKADQIEHAMRHLPQDVVVVTDADGATEPECIRELVALLVSNSRTAIVGATVRPATPLLEEQLHWWFLNRLWWMEGEVLSSAIVSGVCYAMRREAVDLSACGLADDVYLAMQVSARGWRARLCREARAVELRAPQTAAELMDFRRRRGGCYVQALRRVGSSARAPLGWRIAASARAWHFRATPALLAFVAATGCALFASDARPIVLLALAAFAAPPLAGGLVAPSLRREASAPRVAVASIRLVWLTCFSLLTMKPAVEHPAPRALGGLRQRVDVDAPAALAQGEER